MLRLAFDFIITWRETRTRPNAYVKDKKLTGFSRAEEILARKERVVPFDLETELKDRGARYEKALIPMTSKVVIDGNLFTGENPFSSKKMAEVILQCFSKK